MQTVRVINRVLHGVISKLVGLYDHTTTHRKGYRILLFHILPSFHKKCSWLPAFTSFHTIHMQKFAKILSRLQSNPRKTQKFFTANNKYLHI